MALKNNIKLKLKGQKVEMLLEVLLLVQPVVLQ